MLYTTTTDTFPLTLESIDNGALIAFIVCKPVSLIQASATKSRKLSQDPTNGHLTPISLYTVSNYEKIR